MHWLSGLLSEQSLLLLFVIAVVGHIIGKIKVKGISLGVAAVLFVGLVMSAWDEDLVLPPIIGALGLVIFVYSIGIASGPSFFASLKNGGKRNNGLTSAAILAATGLSLLIYWLFNFSPAVIAGLFTGAMTNTPALAGVVQLLSDGSLGQHSVQMASLPAVGYSVAYPMGVLGPILAIAFWQRRFKVNYRVDAEQMTGTVAVGKSLHNKTIRITNEKFCGMAPKALVSEYRLGIVIARVRRGEKEWLATNDARSLRKGDLLSIIGTPEEVAKVAKMLGEISDEYINLDLTHFDRHRMIISSKQVAGRKLRDFHLPQQFGAMITRVKRGDVDMLAHKDLVLEFGDRVLVLSPADKVSELRKFFGDSYRDTSHINVLGIGVGISLGLIIGSIPFDLPGGIVFRLGDAGGPLLVGLVLGVMHRSGPVVWGIPYTANLTLREFGLVMMLASIGTRSGQTFVSALQGSNGPLLFLAAAVISFLVPFVFLPVAYKYLKIPFGVATGMLAATHTQPAVHAYAAQQADNDLPNHGYAIVFPTATILKIILAQVILISLL